MIKTISRETTPLLPPVAVSVSSLFGFTLQEWVYITTVVYALIQIGRQFPKIIGCAVCFYHNGTCKRTCKMT
jgi:hypothetical protein